MSQTFLTELKVVNTRHLHNIAIPLSGQSRKHLILTGQNGCGKTSILHDIAVFLKDLISDDYRENDCQSRIAELKDQLCKAEGDERERLHKQIRDIEVKNRWRWSDGCVVTVNDPQELRRKYMTGEYILAYCRDDRRLNIDICTNPVEMKMKQVYGIDENPAEQIGKYLANLEIVRTITRDKNRKKHIKEWLGKFQDSLRKVYGNKKLELKFDEEKIRHYIQLPDRPPIPIEHMSMGYMAVFDIIGNLMMRMSSRNNFNLEGIVLIDEVETHLHVSLQRQIMPILTMLFPNIQFILTSHSPFVLISTDNAVVYDLERKIRVEDEMTWLSYEGIVEGYFETDRLSQKLRDRFNEYKKELKSQNRNPDRLQDLEDELDKVPTFLALDFMTEYHQLKVDMGRVGVQNDKDNQNNRRAEVAGQKVQVRRKRCEGTVKT